ncbi:efflux ABC transporter, permease protein [Peptostreptococcaceae bacterium oral taxon 113 str. W5053]|nr:efflux ABC transporter, permease protein [Peptostreptococcaceae bacterium oral taxon 113 str. W5053]
MNKLDLLRMGLKNLWRRKLRTFLTILSVVIGATSIVVMISLGLAIKENNKQMLENIGDMTALTVYGNDNDGYIEIDEGGRDLKNNSSKGKKKTLNEDLIKELKELPHVTQVIPVLNLQATVHMKKYFYTGQIIGVRPEDVEALHLTMTEGRGIQPGDKFQVMMSAELAQYGFMKLNDRGDKPPTVDPMKDKFTLDFSSPWESAGNNPFEEETATKKSKSYPLEVVGTYQGSGEFGMIMSMDTVKKLKTEQERFQNQGQGQKKTLEKKKEEVYSRLQVKLDKIENMDSVKNAITEMGLQVHGAGEWMREIEKQSTTIQMVLGGIGSIALIVAAIGIANTMIMSTYERTREIGVMKVIGATVGDVRNLFLFEAAIIGFLGGLFGLLTSHGVSYLLNNVLSLGGFFGGEGEEAVTSIIPLWLDFLALSFSALIGVFSGYFPARRATKLQAIEAIRTE